MSNFQEWLFRWCVRAALHAMPYTARLFVLIREEAQEFYPEDNAYGIDSYLMEAMGYSAPPPLTPKVDAGKLAAWKTLHDETIPASNRYVRAIKAHRDAIGSSLREAKDAVDCLKQRGLQQ